MLLKRMHSFRVFSAAALAILLAGPAAMATPMLNTVPGGTVDLGSGTTLTDSAILSGGVNPTGLLTFFLFAPGVTPNTNNSNNIYSDIVTINGNGTYNTAIGSNPGGFCR